MIEPLNVKYFLIRKSFESHEIPQKNYHDFVGNFPDLSATIDTGRQKSRPRAYRIAL